MAIWRPENWLFSLLFRFLKPKNRNGGFVHVTAIPVLGLTSQMKMWLTEDWQTGIHNGNQLLAYTLQFMPVVTAVNLILQKSPPNQIIWKVSQLAENPYDWYLIRYASASLSAKLKWEAFDIPGLPSFVKHKIQKHFITEIRLDTYPRAVAAGFWYLHEQESEKAVEAFQVVRELLYGQEMYRLAEILAGFSEATDPHTIALIQIEAFKLNSLPPQEKRLRPATWQAITRLERVILEVGAVQRSASPTARSLALNRAQGELQTILEEKENLPQAERQLIIKIAETWQASLLEIAGKVGIITITEPVKHPYIIGNPVEGSLFVGREDILRQLEEFWTQENQLQSVVLFGHRRMGKTSILKNVNTCLGDGVKLAYVNLLDVGNAPQGVGEVLMAICDKVAEIVKISTPTDEDLLNLPYPTFRRFLRQVEKVLVTPPNPPLLRGGENPQTPLKKEGTPPNPPLVRGGENTQTPLKKEGTPPNPPLLRGGEGLIIALDEFEIIENLINAGKIDKDFMGMLRSRVQSSPKIAFAFAGLHTLEEMTEDYFNPFFASIIPIRVGFLSRGSTAQLLANPHEDFLLDYQREALDFIYDLTSGQPYLVQLVGFQLVRRYNQQVFETGKSRDPLFTVADVEAVINDPDFYQRGRYYFTGVWGQAEQDAPGQTDILQVLAPHREGLAVEIVRERTGLDEAILSTAIDTLKRHDVIEEKAGYLRILVELFRRWVGGV